MINPAASRCIPDRDARSLAWLTLTYPDLSQRVEDGTLTLLHSLEVAQYLEDRIRVIRQVSYVRMAVSLLREEISERVSVPPAQVEAEAAAVVAQLNPPLTVGDVFAEILEAFDVEALEANRQMLAKMEVTQQLLRH